MSSNHIAHINYLDEHVVQKICVHKHQDDKRGIEHMKADHGNNMEKVGHVDSFYLSLISRIRFKNHQKLMIRGRLWRFRDTNRRSGLR